MKRYFLVLLTLISISSYAWTPNGETVFIKQLIQWEGNSDVVFETSAGFYCYIPNNEKEMYSLILALMISKKTASIHCYDETSDKGGYQAHKVHRVIATN